MPGGLRAAPGPGGRLLVMRGERAEPWGAAEMRPSSGTGSGMGSGRGNGRGNRRGGREGEGKR